MSLPSAKKCEAGLFARGHHPEPIGQLKASVSEAARRVSLPTR